MADQTRTLNRRTLLLGALPAVLVAGGCFGSFSMTRSMHGWIGSWKSKWLSWLAFVGFVIIGAYGITTLVDALVLNAIEFFKGEAVFDNKYTRGKINTLTGETTIEDGDEAIVMRPEPDDRALRVEHRSRGEVVSVVRLQQNGDGTLAVQDADGSLLAEAQATADGVGLRDAEGNVMMWLGREQAESAAAAVDSGASVSQAVSALLADNRFHNRMLARHRTGAVG
jgi:hypothetical protein